MLSSHGFQHKITFQSECRYVSSYVRSFRKGIFEAVVCSIYLFYRVSESFAMLRRRGWLTPIRASALKYCKFLACMPRFHRLWFSEPLHFYILTKFRFLFHCLHFAYTPLLAHDHNDGLNTVKHPFHILLTFLIKC